MTYGIFQNLINIGVVALLTIYKNLTSNGTITNYIYFCTKEATKLVRLQKQGERRQNKQSH